MPAAGGSGVAGVCAPGVLVLGEVADDVQYGEAETMAKGRRRSRLGVLTASGWRVPGRRRAPVDDALVDRLHIKIVDKVREVRSDVGKRMVASGRSRGGSPVGERRETAADGGTPARNSGGLAASQGLGLGQKGEGKPGLIEVGLGWPDMHGRGRSVRGSSAGEFGRGGC